MAKADLDRCEVDVVKRPEHPKQVWVCEVSTTDAQESGTAYLTPDEAREFARQLMTAADEAEH
jgi:hypothetical protein